MRIPGQIWSDRVDGFPQNLVEILKYPMPLALKKNKAGSSFHAPQNAEHWFFVFWEWHCVIIVLIRFKLRRQLSGWVETTKQCKRQRDKGPKVLTFTGEPGFVQFIFGERMSGDSAWNQGKKDRTHQEQPRWSCEEISDWNVLILNVSNKFHVTCWIL